MAKLLSPSPAAVLAAPPTAGGMWSLAGKRLGDIGGTPDGVAVVLVPTEQVLLLAVPLPPLASTQRRRAALPFAIEDQIAEPLDRVHIALGAELAPPGVWLAAVVGHGLMAQWLDMLAAAGLERARLVPDVMRLPVPAAGNWSVDIADDRALVRTADGGGFAVPAALLDAAWRAAGEPAYIGHGEPLAGPSTAARAGAAVSLTELAIDLRQGPYAARRRPFNPLWQRIVLVAGAGALAHGAIALADTIVLAHQARQRATQVRALGAGLQPPVAIGPDLGDAIVALTPDAAASAPSRFMVLLARSAAALAPGARAATVWRSVSFDGAAGTLTIELETADLADLQRMAQALTSAGLSAQPGSSSTQGGKAVGSFIVRAL